VTIHQANLADTLRQIAERRLLRHADVDAAMDATVLREAAGQVDALADALERACDGWEVYERDYYKADIGVYANEKIRAEFRELARRAKGEGK
jgi:hypothetical protein